MGFDDREDVEGWWAAVTRQLESKERRVGRIDKKAIPRSLGVKYQRVRAVLTLPSGPRGSQKRREGGKTAINRQKEKRGWDVIDRKGGRSETRGRPKPPRSKETENTRKDQRRLFKKTMRSIISNRSRAWANCRVEKRM